MSAASDDNHDNTKDRVVTQEENVWNAVCEGGGHPDCRRSQRGGVRVFGAPLPADSVQVL